MTQAPQLTFSRPTSAALIGKQTVTVKTLVTEDFADDLKRHWKERGYGSEADFMREFVHVAVYGKEHMVDLHRKRIESLGLNRPETVPGAE